MTVVGCLLLVFPYKSRLDAFINATGTFISQTEVVLYLHCL